MSTLPKAPFNKRIITLHYDADSDISRSDCEFDVSHPGKFENEPIYVPFMWNRIMTWGEYPDSQESDSEFRQYCETYDIDPDQFDGDDSEFWSQFDRYVYRPTMEDRLIFPELEYVESVVLWQSDQGFVYSETRTIESGDQIFIGL